MSADVDSRKGVREVLRSPRLLQLQIHMCVCLWWRLWTRWYTSKHSAMWSIRNMECLTAVLCWYVHVFILQDSLSIHYTTAYLFSSLLWRGESFMTLFKGSCWPVLSSFCYSAVQCPYLQELDNGLLNCGDDADVRLSFGNTCSFSCAPGYQLVGASRVTCTSAAEWSERVPQCEGEDAA